MNSEGKFWRSAARHEVQSLTNFAQQSMSNSEMPAAGENFENLLIFIDFGELFQQSGNNCCMLHPIIFWGAHCVPP